MDFIIGVIIFVVVLFLGIGLVSNIVDEVKYKAAKIKNTFAEWTNDEKMPCCECKNCVYKPNNRFSDTDYYCRLSKCENITKETRMICFEKPTMTEEDLNELFSLGIWNSDGQRYIRNCWLGEKTTFSEVNEFLINLAKENPEYINPDYEYREDTD